MTPEGIRSFIAIELPGQVKDELTRLLSILRTTRADVNWTSAQQMHVTLAFLGSVKKETIDGVTGVLYRISRSARPFSLCIGKIGAFPKPAYPRVVWVGIDNPDGGLSDVVDALEEALENLGFSPEKRPFTAHVTLGRVRSPRGRKELVGALTKASFSSLSPFYVNSLVLFQSTLTQKGPLYTPLATALLGGNARGKHEI
ncbi:MAG: RNA 2',3'-cyclic phosphodiesterase [Candidatus Omnitrophica bacterium]|nr:RNA 2',3'-cyclic phosphodiesterase [Candidatus Omnitrophota bacterium]